jgi:phosphoribosylformylglycinamidine cyclo-ligase
VFKWIQRLGEIEQPEMDRVFNLGIGMVLVVSAYYAESVRQQLSDNGLESWPIGFIRQGPQSVVWAG